MPQSKRHPKRRKKIAGRGASYDLAVLNRRVEVRAANILRCWACTEIVVQRKDHPDLAVCNSCILKFKFTCDDCSGEVINVGGELVHLG